MKLDCDINKCHSAAHWYVFVEGFDLAGFYACSHDVAELNRRISLIASAMGGARTFTKKIEDLLPQQIIAIEAKRSGQTA